MTRSALDFNTKFANLTQTQRGLLKELYRTASFANAHFDHVTPDWAGEAEGQRPPRNEREVTGFIKARTRIYVDTWVLPLVAQLLKQPDLRPAGHDDLRAAQAAEAVAARRQTESQWRERSLDEYDRYHVQEGAGGAVLLRPRRAGRPIELRSHEARRLARDLMIAADLADHARGRG